MSDSYEFSLFGDNYLENLFEPVLMKIQVN